MEIEELKEKWNKGIERIHKAENVAKENSELFEKYLNNFYELTKEMSKLMVEYEKLTGNEIPTEVMFNGFR